MHAFWLTLVSVLLCLAEPALADSTPGPVPRSFYLFGPPIGVAPARASAPAGASAVPAVTGPAVTGPAVTGDVCRQAARAAGRAAAVPEGMLSAIARIESGRADGAGGTAPWPWSINVEGIDHVYDSKAEAIAAVRGYQARGARSIDVGCLQVNLFHHPAAFADLDQAFDPAINATYAAQFLVRLRDQTGNWDRAVAAYHSGNPELGEPYRRKVMAALPEEQRIAGTPPPAASLPPGAVAGAAGAVMLGNNAAQGRMLPLAANAAPGRDLGAYRLAPIQLTGRTMPLAASQLTGGMRRPPA